MSRSGDLVSSFSILEEENIDAIIGRNTQDFVIKCKNDLISASEYVETKHEIYLDLISQKLNKIHDTDFSLEFWKRAFSQGLLRQITFLHQTFRMLEGSFDPHECDFKTLSKKYFRTFDNFEEQRNYLGGTYFGQEQLFSLYVSCFYPKSMHSEFSFESTFSARRILTAFKAKILNFIKSIIKKLLNPWSKNPCSVLLLGCYFEKKHISNLQKLSSKLIYYLPQIRNKKHYSYNHNLRSKLEISCESFDSFDKFFFYTLKYILPTHFIEGFNDNLNHYKKLLRHYYNLKYIISEAWLSHTNINLFRAYAFEKKRIKTYYNEHNCIFHPYDGNFISFISKNVDKFLTFGWSSSDSKFVTTSSLFPFKIKKTKKIRKIDILYVSNPCEFFFPTYSTSYSNWGYGSVEHLRFVKSFFYTLSNCTKKSICYRPYPSDYQISGLRFKKEDLLLRYLDGVTFVSSQKFKGDSCKEQMLSSNIVVVDFLSTSYLEALHMNIPTICFWDPSTMSLEAKYSDFFDDLVESKIMHTSPISAAEHLENVYSEPQSWWQSKDVQHLKNRWLKRNFGEEKILLNYLINLAA